MAQLNTKDMQIYKHIFGVDSSVSARVGDIQIIFPTFEILIKRYRRAIRKILLAFSALPISLPADCWEADYYNEIAGVVQLRRPMIAFKDS